MQDERDTIRLPIEGMDCASCAGRVERGLCSAEGVEEASVNFATHEAAVRVGDSRMTTNRLVEVVESVGYRVRLEEAAITAPGSDLEGMRSAVGEVDGVVSVTLRDEAVDVRYVPGRTSASGVIAALRDAGWTQAATDTDPSARETLAEEREQRHRLARRRFLVALVLTLPVFVVSMGGFGFPGNVALQLVLTTPIVLWSGAPFFRGAWSSVRHRAADMNTLVATGVSAAFLYSLVATFLPGLIESTGQAAHVYYEAAATIVTLILGGRLLEEKAKGKAGAAIQELMELGAQTARLVTASGEREVPVEQVRVDDVVRVRPGEKVPLDGEIVEGSSTINESMITGEPVPATKAEGDEVIGATVNEAGSFLMRITRTGDDTMLQQIVRLVRDAQAQKAPVQRMADIVSSIFVPMVLIIAVATFVVWFVIGGEAALTDALLASVSVLLIACPCALGLATPTAIMVASGQAAEHGILLRGGEAAERAGRIDTVVLDKTGTVTEGRPDLVEVVTLGDRLETDLLMLAAAVEQQSEHPLARAVVRSAEERGVQMPSISDFETLTGRGVRATVEGERWLVGSEQFIREEGIALTESERRQAEELRGRGHTVVWLADREAAHAMLSVADPIRATSARAIAALHDLGVEVWICTGDAEETALAVARETGVENVRASMLPEGKTQLVSELQGQGRTVAMVGDGINDAPALARADVGVALGAGTDVAIEASDVTLVRNDLTGVVDAVRLSRKTLRTIKENLFFAFIYNTIGIPIAAGVLYPVWGILLSPMIAAGAMVFSDVSVVLNSLRLLRFQSLRSDG